MGTLEETEQASVGVLSRLYLDYNLDDTYNGLGVQLAVRGIARTLAYAPSESLRALNRLIQPDRVPEYGHAELQFIVDELDSLCRCVPAASAFIRDLYRIFYSLSPASPHSSTVIGARSNIFGMTSDRGQDFRGAKYFAIKKFPVYLDADPVSATEALIEILDLDDRSRHSEVSTTANFDVKGVTASYRADNSSIRYHFFDEDRHPPLHHFERGLADLVDQCRMAEVDRLLDTAYENNCCAALWAALLRTGNTRPSSLGKLLIDLATARPVLDGHDCRYEAVDLVCTLHGSAESHERLELEARILQFGSDVKATVLGCLDRERITMDELVDQYNALKVAGELRDNRPVIISHGTFAYNHDDRNAPRDQGTYGGDTVDRDLVDAVRRVQNIEHADPNSAESFEDLLEKWKEIVDLYDRILRRGDTPETSLASALDAVGRGAYIVFRAVQGTDQLGQCYRAEEVIFGILDHTDSAANAMDRKIECQFAEHGTWGELASRVESTRALLELTRILQPAHNRIVDKVILLARDGCPAVRDSVFAVLGQLQRFQPNLACELCAVGFSSERNPRVLVSLLRSCRSLLRDRPSWYCQAVLALDDRVGLDPPEGDAGEALADAIVWLVLRLWFIYEQASAGRRIDAWLARPIQNEYRVCAALSELRTGLRQGESPPVADTDSRVRTEAVRFFETLTRGLVAEGAIRNSDLSRVDRKQLRSTFKILDYAMAQIYFASGAQASAGSFAETPSDVATAYQFLQELEPTLSFMAQVPHPSVCHRLLETLEYLIPVQPEKVFLLMTDAVVQGGEGGGYEFEALAVELFVRTVHRYIADYKQILLGDDEKIRDRLLESLDRFVDAGWPSARRLAHGLPEMLR